MHAFLFRFLILTVLFIMPVRVVAAEYLPILNSYTSMKLHLDDANGQMVGAAWIRVRNNTDAPISEIPFVLNPGLYVTNITGKGNAMLTFNSDVTPVEGYEYLEATNGKAQLLSPIKPGGETELVIHYKGTLQAIGWAGIEGADETLASGFTIIRAESFGYPVIAAANKASIEAAIGQPAYFQTATVDLPQGYDIAGNLTQQERTTNGSNDKIDLKSKYPTKAMLLPIGHFDKTTAGPITIATQQSVPRDTAEIIERPELQMKVLTGWLGAPKRELAITYIPDGFGSRTEAGFLMFPENLSGDQTLNRTALMEVNDAVSGLWGLSEHTQGAWDTGLKTVINTLLANEDTKAAKATAFNNVMSIIVSEKELGKTSLPDFPNPSLRDAVGKMFFWVLYEKLGSNDFFAFARMLRTELPNSKTGYQMLADVISEENAPKTAKKLSKNWLEKGKLAKDFKKAKSFADVVKRY